MRHTECCSKLFRSFSLNWYSLILILIFCMGCFLRFSGLGREAFWFNEAASWFYAKGSITDAIRHSFVDETNPPGFHLLIHFWEMIAGIHEWALRLPGAAIGSLSILLMYPFARMFLSRWASLLAASLLALSPLHIWYSQECRSFVFWFFFLMAAYVFFLKWVDSRRVFYLILNSVLIAIAVAFHYFAFHAVIIENVYLLLGWRLLDKGQRRSWIISQCLLALALLPFLIMMLSVDRSNVMWWRESGVNLQTLKALFFHLNGVFFFLHADYLPKMLMIILNMLALGMGLWGLVAKRRGIFLLLAIILPIFLNLSYSVLVSPILGNSQSAGRYFLFILPPYLVLLSIGWQDVFKKVSLPVATLLLVLFFLSNVLGIKAMHTNDVFQRDDNRRLCRILFEKARENDILIAAPFITVDYYAALYGYPLEHLRVFQTTRFQKTLLSSLPANVDRIWLYIDPEHHFQPLVAEMKDKYGLQITIVEHERKLSGVGLYLLERPASEKFFTKLRQ